MSKWVELCITQHKIILVEVEDDSNESISLAVDVAENSVDGDIGDSEIVGIHDSKPSWSVDDVIMIEDYSE